MSARAPARSRDSTTCADTALSFNSRASLPSARSTSRRTSGVMSTCLPVSSSRMGPTGSVQDLALIRRRDLQLFAVLRNGPPGELEPLALQDADDLRVA